MKYFSMFSGIGGFELGIQNSFKGSAKIESSSKNNGDLSDDPTVATQERGQSAACVGYSEVDKYAIQIYQKHFPNHKGYGDATKIDATNLPDFELLVGGFPCQAFSIAGQRRGFDDTRGTLFFEIARILKEKRPRMFLLENVKGLLSHDNGRTFKTIIATLAELGYCVEWQVLNSKDFGVPQNRERVFIVGYLGGERRQKVFPIRCVNEENYGKNTSNAHIGTLRTHKDGEGSREIKSGISPTIPARARNDGSGQPVLAIPEATKQGYAIAQPGDSINLSVINSKTRRGRVGKGIAQTLDTGMNQHTLDNCRIRRLTPVECERLQGFPDGWTEGLSDTQRYKCLGNAVTVNVIQAIIERML